MSRLIDADDLINKINAYCTGSQDVDFIRNLIKEQPTAYDIEKVVTELESLEDTDTREVYLTHHIDCDKAIDIVRKGGME